MESESLPNFPGMSIIKTLHSSKISKVWLVKEDEIYSILKGINISRNSDFKSVEHIKSERSLLTEFQKGGMQPQWIKPLRDSENIYLNYSLVEGTDLSKIFKTFDFSSTQFFNSQHKLASPTDLANLMIKKIQLFSKVVCQVIKSLTEIHKLGYIYRDLKMNNLIINENFDVFLIDFGFTKQVGYDSTSQKCKERTASVCGTYHAMPLEMLNNKMLSLLNGLQEVKYGFEVDYYSLGILIFELYAGMPPYNYVYEFSDSNLLSIYEEKLKGFDSQKFKELYFNSSDKLDKFAKSKSSLTEDCSEQVSFIKEFEDGLFQILKLLINNDETKRETISISLFLEKYAASFEEDPKNEIVAKYLSEIKEDITEQGLFIKKQMIDEGEAQDFFDLV